MKKHEQLILQNVEITSIAAEGKAIARVDNLVVFISNAVPGDVADIRIMRKKKNYAEGVAFNFQKYSAQRAEPVCSHFGICGGCKWQHLGYEWQLQYKQQQVTDALTRIGKVQFPEIFPIIGSKEIYNYRNRLDFSFSDRKWLTDEEMKIRETIADHHALGFHIPGTFDKVLDIRECHLQGKISEDIRKFVREFAVKKNFSFFNIRNKSGLLRNLIIRTASTGEVMVVVIFCEDDEQRRAQLLTAIAEKFPQVTSLMYIINPKANDTFFDLPVHTFSGRDHIFEKMEGLQFKVGPKSFYQTNAAQAHALYKVAREFAGLTGNENVYDLYTGTGTIALFTAQQTKKVTGIDITASAIEDAIENAALNNISNAAFFAADMKEIFNPAFMDQNGKPDVIITDPPRAGMHENVTRSILQSGAQRVVYVSCNPASQARDLALLDENYSIAKVQPVDMFPQTHHVENVVLLGKK